jgi:hypothetical protein
MCLASLIKTTNPAASPFFVDRGATERLTGTGVAPWVVAPVSPGDPVILTRLA